MGSPSLPATRVGACVCERSNFTRLCLAALTLIPVVLYGETNSSSDAVAAPVESVADAFLRSRVLASGTEVHLRLLEPVASHTHRRGDRFKLEVAELIAVDGEVIVPAGSPAIGEVIHAAKPGASGKAGELILVVRGLRAGDHQVKLRSFTAGNGENRYGLATGLGVTLGIPALFVV